MHVGLPQCMLGMLVLLVHETCALPSLARHLSHSFRTSDVNGRLVPVSRIPGCMDAALIFLVG